jgi:hypothetical protein
MRSMRVRRAQWSSAARVIVEELVEGRAFQGECSTADETACLEEAGQPAQ